MEPFSLLAGTALSSGLKYFSDQSNQANQKEFNAAQLAMAQKNLEQQKEFAQHGISWKVQDAMGAGLHPLAALGAQTSSFSPVSLGGEAVKSNMDFGSMGQDITRALKATANAQERENSDESKARALELENKGLQNDVLRQQLASQIARTGPRSGQVGPPMPLEGNRIPLPRPGPDRTEHLGAAVKDDDIKQKAEDFPQTKVGRPFGYPLYHNPWFGDGQSFEDRYGESEIASTLKWGVNTLADHGYTAYMRWPEFREWMSRHHGLYPERR